MKSLFEKWFVRKSSRKSTSPNNLGWPDEVHTDLRRSQLVLTRKGEEAAIDFVDLSAIRHLGDVVQIITPNKSVYITDKVWSVGQVELPHMEQINRKDFVNPSAMETMVGNSLFVGGFTFHCAYDDALQRIKSTPLADGAAELD